nr:hypothetical protein [Miltoncostaea marina]
MAVDAPRLGGPPVARVAGAVGAGGREVGHRRQAPVDVRAGREAARQADEAPQAERRHGPVPVACGVGGHEARRHHHVVVDRDDDLALRGGEPPVAGRGRREAGPPQPQPLGAQQAARPAEPPVAILGGRAADHDHLQPLGRVALLHEAPQGGGEMRAPAAVGDHDADVGGLGRLAQVPVLGADGR